MSKPAVPCPQCHQTMTRTSELVVEPDGVETADYECPVCGARHKISTQSSSVSLGGPRFLIRPLLRHWSVAVDRCCSYCQTRACRGSAAKISRAMYRFKHRIASSLDLPSV